MTESFLQRVWKEKRTMGQLAVGISAKIEEVITKEPKARTGVAFPRYFTARLEPGKTPYDEVQWETRTASISNDKGAVIFELLGSELRFTFSPSATLIGSTKRFFGKLR